MKTKISAKEFLEMLIGMFLMSVAVYYLMMPNHLVLGSLSGLVLVLVNFIPLKVSTLTFIINIFLLLIGYIFVGKEFGLKTLLTSLMLPMYLRIFETVTPNVGSLSGNIVIDLAYFMIVLSAGQALLFNMNASSGGVDIIAKLVSKYFKLKIGVSLTIVGLLIALSSALVYDRQIVVISLLGTYINGLVLDRYCDGFLVRRKISIISENYLEIQKYILEDLHRGVTLYEAHGGFDDTCRIELVTILEKNEYGKLMAYIRETDPSAFMTVSTVNEVVGEWNRMKKGLFG